MDCFGTCFTHAQTSDVKPPCKHPFSAEGFKPPSSPLQGEAKGLCNYKQLQLTLPSHSTYLAPPAARVASVPKPPKQKDAGATQITLLTSILLPLLLRSTYRPDHAYARPGRVFSQLSLPLFPRTRRAAC